MKRCKLCLRTVWEQYIGIPGRDHELSGIFYHHHNGMRECFPYQVAEVDDDNPRQEYFEPVPVKPEKEPEERKEVICHHSEIGAFNKSR